MSVLEAVTVAKSSGRVLTIDISGTVTLDETELWPDGDAPEGWTAQDVADLVDREGPRWLYAWNLEGDVTVTLSDDQGNNVDVAI
jgi:hypothetical protein